MNLPKAIELNKESEMSLRNHKFIDFADAIKLSNEAITELQELRETVLGDAWSLLPGETKE